jgi:hypothetical protein
MRLQALMYETFIAIISVLLLFLILSFLNIRKSEIEEKIAKVITYDAVFSLDALRQLSEYSLSNILKTYFFKFFEEGKIKGHINISCICSEKKLLFLNNLFKDGINVNGRNVKIYFFPTKFPLSLNDYKADGLIIWDCTISSEILSYSKYAGILFICDISDSFFYQNSYILTNVFGISKNCNSNGLANVNLKKPLFGSNASYKVYKILIRSSFFYRFSENEEISNYLNLNAIACAIDPIFAQKNNNNLNAACGASANYYNNNIMIWSSDFLRNKDLDLFLTSTSTEDLKLKKILSTFILAISKKTTEIPSSYLKNSIHYANYFLNEFIEPYLVTISISKI